VDICFSDVSVAHGAKSVLRHLTCVFPEGVHYVFAQNGVGKTTLLEVAVGLVTPTWGAVTWGDDPLALAVKRRRVPAAYCPTHPSFYDGARVDEAIRLYHFMNDITTLGDPLISFDPFGLGNYRSKYFGELSFGWKKRVLLHMALSVDAPLLALDEPYVGLDRESRSVLAELIGRRLHHGVTLVTSNGDINDIPTDGSVHRLLSPDASGSVPSQLVRVSCQRG
jgi:ABC-type multidrug transport system ATPase subunit